MQAVSHVIVWSVVATAVAVNAALTVTALLASARHLSVPVRQIVPAATQSDIPCLLKPSGNIINGVCWVF